MRKRTVMISELSKGVFGPFTSFKAEHHLGPTDFQIKHADIQAKRFRTLATKWENKAKSLRAAQDKHRS